MNGLSVSLGTNGFTRSLGKKAIHYFHCLLQPFGMFPMPYAIEALLIWHPMARDVLRDVLGLLIQWIISFRPGRIMTEGLFKT